MKKVMVLQSAKAYKEDAYLTKHAYLAYCEKMFGVDSCELAYVPHEAYDVGYSIVTGEPLVMWTDDAISKLAEAIKNVDVVILTLGTYPWKRDCTVHEAVEKAKTTTIMEYDPKNGRLVELNLGDDSWM